MFSKQTALTLLYSAFLIGVLTNCGEGLSDGGDSSEARPLSMCDQELMEAFASSYRPFLSDGRLCARCHSDGGISPVKFASSNLGSAFSHFLRVGADRVDTNAISTNHAPGVTGPQNQPQVTAARSAWDPAFAAYQACLLESGGARATELSTIDKNIPTLYFQSGTVVTLSWLLSTTDVNEYNSRFPGVLSIDVRVNYQTVDGVQVAQGYTFTNPRLQMLTGEREVEVEGVIVKINGVQATGIEPFLSARRVVRGINNTNIYSGNVNVDLPSVSSGDQFSLGLGYFVLRDRTDNPPIPPAPTIAANNPYARTTTINVTASNDSTARLWCVTAINRPVRDAAEACPGFETQANRGWVSTRPTTFDLATRGSPPQNNEVIPFYLWIANSDLKLNTVPASSSVTFDIIAPNKPVLTSVSLGTTQIADLVGLDDSNEVVSWCVKESAISNDVQAAGGCNFTANKPSFIGLKGGGTRFVGIFTRDRAGNTSLGSDVRSVVNTHGRITFEQLTTVSFGDRAVFANNCFSCHGTGGAQQGVWDATDYAATVAREALIMTRTGSTTSPMPPTGLLNPKDKALIDLWFTQTGTPVQQ